MAVREAEVQAGLRRDVQLVRRHVVAEHVAAVVGEPQLACHRVPIEPDAVAHALGEHLHPGSVGLHPDDGRHHGRRRADVARRADRHVEHVVRPEGDELPRVAGLRVRQVVADGDRRGQARRGASRCRRTAGAGSRSPHTAPRSASRRHWVDRARWRSARPGPPCGHRCCPRPHAPCQRSAIRRTRSRLERGPSCGRSPPSRQTRRPEIPPAAPMSRAAPRPAGQRPSGSTRQGHWRREPR